MAAWIPGKIGTRTTRLGGGVSFGEVWSLRLGQLNQ